VSVAANEPGEPHRARPSRSRAARAAWAALGLVCVAVGALGIVLPGLPTTPFLILAAACFMRSSQRLYDRLLGNRAFGPAVRRFRETGGVSRAAKWSALGTMAFFVLFAVLWGIPAEWRLVRGLVLLAGVLGAVYVARLPVADP
jgi:uncharacterized membrane protein YbaN (DUF454 family)